MKETTPVELSREKFDSISSVAEIPGFPFPSFSSMKEAVSMKSITIGAASDFARQWCSQGSSSPSGTRMYMTALAYMYFILPIALIIIALLIQKPLYVFFSIPFCIGLLALRPISVKAMPLLKAFMWAGYVLLLGVIFMGLGLWAVFLAACSLIPWWLNKHIYSHATNIAIREALNTEKRFVELFKLQVIALQFSHDSSLLWGYQLVKVMKP